MKQHENLIADVIDIMSQSKSRGGGKVTHSDIIGSLRGGIGAHYFLKSGRGWRLPGNNRDQEEFLTKVAGLKMERVYSKKNPGCIRMTLYSLPE